MPHFAWPDIRGFRLEWLLSLHPDEGADAAAGFAGRAVFELNDEERMDGPCVVLPGRGRSAGMDRRNGTAGARTSGADHREYSDVSHPDDERTWDRDGRVRGAARDRADLGVSSELRGDLHDEGAARR